MNILWSEFFGCPNQKLRRTIRLHHLFVSAMLILGMTYRPLKELCSTKAQYARILNALWMTRNASPRKRPNGWEPTPEEVSEISLDTIPNIGVVSIKIIEKWIDINQGRHERG